MSTPRTLKSIHIDKQGHLLAYYSKAQQRKGICFMEDKST
uniref:Uncharacterized protein n=1 Tax=Rhizophora mucronata TaxID=61149 RepID=A0A2P2PZB1_RHIMU